MGSVMLDQPARIPRGDLMLAAIYARKSTERE